MTQLKEFSTLTSEAKLGISKLEALLKHLLLPQGPGARIYQEKHLSWLFQPAMRQQLPPLYHFIVILKYWVLSIAIALRRDSVLGLPENFATSHLVFVSPLHEIFRRLLITTLLARVVFA
jgi:hypothetical protein